MKQNIQVLMLVSSSNKSQCSRSDMTKLIPATPLVTPASEGQGFRFTAGIRSSLVALHAAQRTNFT